MKQEKTALQEMVRNSQSRYAFFLNKYSRVDYSFIIFLMVESSF